MTAQFGQCCYVIAVHDVVATQAYFVEKLAFEPLEIDAPGWRFVQRGTARFDMGECVGIPEAKVIGDHSWIARIFVDGLDDYYGEIQGRGATIPAPPITKPWGLREMLVVTPDGHRIMFCEVMAG